jgi:small subunit ribosomal protein S9
MADTNVNSLLIDPKLVTPTTAPATPSKKTTPDKGGFIWGTGRRKSSVARVRVKPGKGELMINDRRMMDYFKLEKNRSEVTAPLKATDTVNSVDVYVNVHGGGITGQSGAIMLGIARALKNYDPNLMKALRDGGFLTRDSRMVERKKPGKPGARRSFQFSKR